MARGVWQHSVSKNDCERSAQENFGTLAHTKSKLDRNFIKIVLIQGFKAFLKGFRVWLVQFQVSQGFSRSHRHPECTKKNSMYHWVGVFCCLVHVQGALVLVYCTGGVRSNFRSSA